MIENFNASKTVNENYVDYKKYIGVASISVLAVNPSNSTLAMYGWNIPEDAEEPRYVTTNNEGKRSARVCFLVQLHDLKDKPVIMLNFWVRPEIQFNGDQSKCQIIDPFGRSAYATKSEVQTRSIPQYSNGLANISSDYKPAHVGEETLVKFIMKLLNVTPLQMFSKTKNEWVPTKNPGRLTIDNWGNICNGDVSEVREYLKLQPENRVKVVLGIRTTDDNKSYQTFLPSLFIGNGARVDITTGEYTSARKAIDKDREWADNNGKNYPFIYSAAPVKEWVESATEVSDNSGSESVPETNEASFFDNTVDDLPFGN